MTKIITSVGKAVEKLETSCFWWKCKQGTAAVENSLVVLQRVKHRVPVWPCNSTPRCLPRRRENTHPCKDLCMNVHSNILHNSQKVKNIPNCIHWWRARGNTVYTYNVILFCHKKWMKNDVYYVMSDFWKHAQGNKPDTKGHIGSYMYVSHTKWLYFYEWSH